MGIGKAGQALAIEPKDHGKSIIAGKGAEGLNSVYIQRGFTMDNVQPLAL